MARPPERSKQKPVLKLASLDTINLTMAISSSIVPYLQQRRERGEEGKGEREWEEGVRGEKDRGSERREREREREKDRKENSQTEINALQQSNPFILLCFKE